MAIETPKPPRSPDKQKKPLLILSSIGTAVALGFIPPEYLFEAELVATMAVAALGLWHLRQSKKIRDAAILERDRLYPEEKLLRERKEERLRQEKIEKALARERERARKMRERQEENRLKVLAQIEYRNNSDAYKQAVKTNPTLERYREAIMSDSTTFYQSLGYLYSIYTLKRRIRKEIFSN